MADVVMVVGARPNFMKAAPVYAALAERGVDLMLVHTGQHYDRDMSEVFLDQLGLPHPHVFLGIGSGSHAEQTARCLTAVEQVLVESPPELVIVPGDVNSTLAAALAAVKLEIPVAHLEAGLRSYDRSMPEEHNRVLTDHVSSLLLTHSASAVDNLAAEAIAGDHVVLVGNTMIDSLLSHLEAARAAAPLERLGVAAGAFGLVTLHRPSLVDDADALARTARALRELAQTHPLVFPVHPRTAERLERAGLDLAGVRLVPPLGYLEFLGLEAAARFVVTDSGGVQEETSALGVPCFTLRSTTERPVTIELGTNLLLGLAPERLAEVPGLLAARAAAPQPIPLWDGHAGERAADAVTGYLGRQ